VLLEDHVDLDEYFDTDGYFPAGLPICRDQELRGKITRMLSAVGNNDLLQDCGNSITSEPFRDSRTQYRTTYRGELAELRLLGARVESVPLTAAGLALDLVDRGGTP
jgi:hypothetical protein